MVSAVYFRLPYDHMNYVMFGFDAAAVHQSLYDCYLGVRCSGFECRYLILRILLLRSYFIMVITGITNMFIGTIILFQLQI